MSLQKTALYESHVKQGAKMVEFAGFSMPLQFTSAIQEHRTVRNCVGLFDVSHMGQFLVEGAGSTELLEYLTSNAVHKLYDGKAQYSCLMNAQGGIVDDLIVYRLDSTKYLIIVNAANIEKDFAHFQKYANGKVHLENLSQDYSLIAVQGPQSIALLSQLCSHDFESMTFYTFSENVEVAGVGGILVSSTGYTGEKGFELLVNVKDSEKIWNSLLEKGRTMGALAAGLTARDTLRLEAGYCLYGNDIDDSITPLEAGLGWITKLNTKFLGSDILVAQKEKGLAKKLVGLKVLERGIPRRLCKVYNSEKQEIGYVTSGGISPTKNIGIALGYLAIDYTKLGTEVFLEIRSHWSKTVVSKPPFHK